MTTQKSSRTDYDQYSSVDTELDTSLCHSFLGSVQHRGMQSVLGFLDKNNVSILDLSNHANYRKVAKDRVEFRIGKNSKDPEVILSVSVYPDIEEGYTASMEIQILKGNVQGRYLYTRYSYAPQGDIHSIEDICIPYECPNINAIPEIKTVLSNFALDMQNGNHLCLKKVS